MQTKHTHNKNTKHTQQKQKTHTTKTKNTHNKNKKHTQQKHKTYTTKTQTKFSYGMLTRHVLSRFSALNCILITKISIFTQVGKKLIHFY